MPTPYLVTRAAAMLAASIVLALGFPVPSTAEPSAGFATTLRRLVSDDKLAGAVAVIRDGARTRLVSAGESDLQTHSGFSAQVHVRVASITKAFAAATMLQMVATGPAT